MPGSSRISSSGFAQDRLRDAHTLLETAGELSDGVRIALAEFRRGHAAADSPRLGLAAQTFQVSGIVQVIGDGHFGVDGEVFRQVAQRALDVASVRFQIQTADARAPRTGFEIAAEHFHDGGLARAVVAEEADDLALVNGEGNLIDCRVPAVIPGQRLCIDHGGVFLLEELLNGIERYER